MPPCGKHSRSINPGLHQTDLLGCSGQTENYTYIKLLMGAIVCFIGMSRNTWNLHLQQFAGALRSTIGLITGIRITGIRLTG